MDDYYRQVLASSSDWDDFLMAESRLPGPRGNLELAHIAAEAADATQIEHWISFNADIAPTNTAEEFLAFCGVLGLGKLLAAGDLSQLEHLFSFASDPRWRTREAVAMALQHYGRVDMDGLINAMYTWSQSGFLEQRAAAAALCEPGLLVQKVYAERVLDILDRITHSISNVRDRKDANFKILRKGMGYCWSVAIVACPNSGKYMLERWIETDDTDILWIMKQNLQKNRLKRLDPDWVSEMLKRIN